jgi:hypothetical protein
MGDVLIKTKFTSCSNAYLDEFDIKYLALYLRWLHTHIANKRYDKILYILYCTLLGCSFMITVILWRMQGLWESSQREDKTALLEILVGNIASGERGLLWTPLPIL